MPVILTKGHKDTKLFVPFAIFCETTNHPHNSSSNLRSDPFHAPRCLRKRHSEGHASQGCGFPVSDYHCFFALRVTPDLKFEILVPTLGFRCRHPSPASGQNLFVTQGDDWIQRCGFVGRIKAEENAND